MGDCYRCVSDPFPPPPPPPRLWPVLAVGFKDLLSRASAQQQAIEENQGRLRSLGELQHRMARQHAGELKGRAAEVQKRHIELSHRLMHVTRLLDALDSRLASNLGWVLIKVWSGCVSVRLGYDIINVDDESSYL